MTTDVSPTPVADPTSLTLTSPALLAAVGLYAAAAQVAVAGRVGRGTADSGIVTAVLLGTLGLVLLYVASRTTTLPFGGVHTVHNDRPQDPVLLGTVVVAAELLTLVAGQALLPARTRRVAVNAMLLVGAGLWGAWGLGVL